VPPDLAGDDHAILAARAHGAAADHLEHPDRFWDVVLGTDVVSGTARKGC
jgi:hypothetical protein